MNQFLNFFHICDMPMNTDFESLKTSKMSMNEKLILYQLIVSLRSNEEREKALQANEVHKLSLEATVEFSQYFSQI